MRCTGKRTSTHRIQRKSTIFPFTESTEQLQQQSPVPKRHHIFRYFNISKRISCNMMIPHLKMKVTAGNISGGADISDDLPSLNDVTCLDGKL